ncbi:MAG: response regulator transcription factor [Pegethrix bostrychoides GSE-TBD4-15B]|jgi:DNA-binding response OmpR family regulator|uniref:Response regulator transcription factor n=1 Tax=Pegethrix bostrychoides GSE-TBD4-15B TaxID=2839662 RepID=A0A951PD32_9CYAN|nr:response regulator transcription factor [Pegethrix bostrychoides GSE-TBD4-15B]
MRILLVEDEPDLGTAIKWALKQERYIVDWAQDGREAWEFLQSPDLQYSLAIFDWMLPNVMGIELCQRLRLRQNRLPVLMLTARDRLQDRIAGLDAGADDYLVKPFEMEELLARLRALQRRSPDLQTQQIQFGSILLNYTERQVYCQQGERQVLISLTHKEFQLLEYFMSHPRQTVTKDQLLAQLWESGSDVGSNVVAAQVRLLRRKLAEQGCSDLIETLPSMGYRLNPDYC